jgi:hypothetical protein
MRYIIESGPKRGVSDNLFLNSAAAYKKILQMKEVLLRERVWKESRLCRED